jgi:hypothetical protein
MGINESVFFGRYRSVFLGIYHTDTEGKLGQNFRSKFWRESLKKLAGAPFFLRRGGLGPLFVNFALLLKKKRNYHGIFQKMSSRKILIRCSRQSLQYNNVPTEKYQYQLYLIPGK